MHCFHWAQHAPWRNRPLGWSRRQPGYRLTMLKQCLTFNVQHLSTLLVGCCRLQHLKLGQHCTKIMSPHVSTTPGWPCPCRTSLWALTTWCSPWGKLNKRCGDFGKQSVWFPKSVDMSPIKWIWKRGLQTKHGLLNSKSWDADQWEQIEYTSSNHGLVMSGQVIRCTNNNGYVIM